MPDRSKVIRSIETAVKNFERYSGDEYGREYDYARVEVETLEDALALLKAQEPIEARLHLCESCTKEYPECDATIDGMEFGCGVGNDNIIGCTAYVNRWKAHASVEPMLKNGWYWCGGIGCRNSLTSVIGNDVPALKPNYCEKCGRKVKWE